MTLTINQPRHVALIEAPAAKVSRPTIALTALMLVAAGLRIPGVFTDFWGDEIWSWSIAGQLHSVFDVLMAAPAHIDNNHPLNTLWLYLVGQNRPIWLYRLPALLAGVGSVLLAYRIMLRRGQAEAIIAGLLFGFSYPLIFYSSEARGYSFAVFFSLLSFHFLGRALLDSTESKRPSEGIFGLATILGFLSHLTFLHIYVGAVVWSMVRVRGLEPTTRLRALRLARLHAIPLVFIFLLFHYFVRDMVVGGAPPTSAGAVFLQSLAVTAGSVEAGPLAILTAALVSGLFIAGLVYLAREKSETWIFFLFAVFVSPALACTRDLYFSERPQPLMLRYFLVCIAMLLFSVVPLVANFWRRGGVVQAVVAGGLLFFIFGDLRNEELFLQSGRGNYAQALQHILDLTPDQKLIISSDNPLRTDMLISFYGARLAPRRQIKISTTPEKWLILNRPDRNAAAKVDFGNGKYLLDSIYRYRGFSGWTWEVYLALPKHTL